MSRATQSKAQNEANAKILRALVKQPDNKTCADCKRNDPRWASWNIGCFLCIRCSGIHRSMGTHISKVKSIDLDIWTPEQMTSIQKWGNKRSNLYWEAHLRAGHAPADHKVESFIRSKYETRRWAKEGPPPQDPSVLDGGSAAPAAAASPAAAVSPSQPTSQAAAPRPSAIDLLGGDPSPAPAPAPTVSRGAASSLLDDDAGPGARTATRQQPQAQQAATNSPPPQPKASSSSAAGGGLFELDWHESPAPSAGSAAKPTPTSSNNKSDILSLFNSTRPTVRSPPAPQQSSSGFGGLDDSFGSLSVGTQSQPQPSSASTTTPSSNPWASNSTNAATTGMFGSSDIWGGSSGGTASAAKSTTNGGNNDIWGDFSSGSGGATATTSSSAVKDDPFGDIWK